MPSPETVRKALSAIKRRADYEYFFDQLQTPDWIKPLWDAGMFRAPDEPEREGRYVRFPPWPESRYLARMATIDPVTVMKVALQIPNTENVRVHEDLIDAALAMPPKLAVKFIPKAKMWLESPYQLLHEKLGSLVEHLAKGGRIKAALDLAKTLLAVMPDPRAREKATHRLSPEPSARFDIWNYEQILQRNIPSLVDAAGKQALMLLCDLLESAIRLSRIDENDHGPEDYSYIWRPAIEEHEQNRNLDIRALLVSAVRDATERIASTNAAEIRAVAQKLWERDWKVFRRLAIHIVRKFPETVLDRATDWLTNRTLFDDPGIHHEYSLLARDLFARLAPAHQETILGWIERGPDIDAIQTFWERETGQRLTTEQLETDRKWWQLRKLSILYLSLPEQWQGRYRALKAELGEPEHPEFSTYTSGGWVGPSSPKSVDDLNALSSEELRNYLLNWQPETKDPLGFGSSPEGLGRAITTMVSNNPERCALLAPSFQGLDPTYVRGFLQGIREVSDQSKVFSWEPVIGLCQWVMQQPQNIGGRVKKYLWEADPDWNWTRKAIADLLYSGLQDKVSTIPFDQRHQVWAIIHALSQDPNPTQEYEGKYGGSTMAANLSINSTRGQAMHAVVHYALWVRRHMLKQPSDSECPSFSFDVVPEAREVLDAHLNPEIDPAFSIRSVYGQWLPWLILLDREWVTENVMKIFPREAHLKHFRDAAWQTYIIFCTPYDDVFDVLKNEYGHAVEQIVSTSDGKQTQESGDNRLAEHLMTFYWRGKISLSEPGSVVERFYSKAPDILRGYALEFVGRSLYNTKGLIPSEVLERIRALWLWRLDKIKACKKSISYVSELVAFGWWFASAKFDDKWSLSQLAWTLKLARRTASEHLVIERLEKVSKTMPREAVYCLKLIIEGDERNWVPVWRNQTRSILEHAIQSSDVPAQQSAEDLIHYLGARDNREFRDLLH